MNLNDALQWIAVRGLALLIVVAILLVVYRIGLIAIRRLLPRVMAVPPAALGSEGTSEAELAKRTATIQDLLIRLLRLAVAIGVVVGALAIFDLWAMVAGIGLVLAAFLLASQEIVLDYAMGLFILVEGQFYRGDWIKTDDGTLVIEGEVQEVGLRRTVLRDVDGAVHSVSNGLIRAASNLTRAYSVALVEVDVLRTADLERAMEVARSVLSSIAGSDAQSNVVVTHVGSIANTIRATYRVPPDQRWTATAELRRRLAAAMTEASIPISPWDAPQPVVVQNPEG
jgi:moderate conductance mechanosensitive channel